jgi:hypothetical protein
VNEDAALSQQGGIVFESTDADNREWDVDGEKLRAFIHKMKLYLGNFQRNADRVKHLIAVHESVPDHVRDDILRSAVVLMHATLEDFLRNIAVLCFPVDDDKKLDGVSWRLGTDKPLDRIPLGVLAKQRGRSVEEVLRLAIEADFAQKSFTDSTKIMGLLATLALSDAKLAGIRQFLPSLDEMIARRHRIVHFADLEKVNEEHGERPIDAETVARWRDNMSLFVISVTGLICGATEIVMIPVAEAVPHLADSTENGIFFPMDELSPKAE